MSGEIPVYDSARRQVGAATCIGRGRIVTVLTDQRTRELAEGPGFALSIGVDAFDHPAISATIIKGIK